MSLDFQLVACDPSGARAGVLHTRRGPALTPVFMPVGTHATVSALTAEEVASTGASIILGNTYHLMLRPGMEVFRHFGGIHGFMGWQGPVLTDSGGYQIFSLPADREITEKGAHFKSFHDNSKHLLSPETSIGMQGAIGSEIMMPLDVCIDSTCDEDTTRAAMERTHRWALRSLEAKQQLPPGQALFAIVQGGTHPSLRDESAAFVTQYPFDGFAIGGLAVGESKADREEMTLRVALKLPAHRPRYLMGVGTPQDLLEAVKRGVDMFDCIIPTKMAQQGYAYTFQGQMRVARQVFRLSKGPLDPTCNCPVCSRYSLGYLNHLVKNKHRLGTRLLAIHNLAHYYTLMQRVRMAILEHRFESLYRELTQLLNR